ncbi:MAG: hypothetical protein ABI431_09540 [Candidatus Tumulicola sp.]
MFELRRAALRHAGGSIGIAGVVAAALLSSVLLAGAPASAQTAVFGDPPPFGIDPFCGVQLSIAGWDVRKNAESAMSDHLLAKLTTSGKNLSAQMVLMSPTEAFSVRVPPLPTSKYATGNVTPEFFIALPKNAEINRAYVESYTIGGAPETQCLVEPLELGRFGYSVLGLVKPDRAMLPRYLSFPAAIKEKLPATDCGAPDREAIVTHAEQPDGIENLDKTRIAVVAVYIDATGHVAKTYLTRSSGIDVSDAQGQAAAIRSTYQPALMHCMPVNQAYLFTAEFDK